MKATAVAPTEQWKSHAAAGGGRPPPVRTGMRPEPQPHPLHKPQTAAEKRSAAKAKLEATLPPASNPMTREHGVYGYMVVFDINSADSFNQAHAAGCDCTGRCRYTGGCTGRCCYTGGCTGRHAHFGLY